MNILVIGNKPGTSFKQIRDACDDIGQRAVFVPWDSLVADIGRTEMVWSDHFLAHSDGNPQACIALVRGMPRGSLEQVVFQMNVLARLQHCGVSMVNSGRSLEIAIDKYLTLSLAKSNGLPVPDSIVCQTVDAAMAAFDKLDRDVVVKPVFGGEGRGITRITDPEIAWRCFRAIVSHRGVVFQQRFIDSGNRDIRILVVGDKLFAMTRSNPNDWRTNVSRGAICQPFSPNDNQIQIAKLACQTIEANFAAVDLIQRKDGTDILIEINGVPGWQNLQNTCGVNIAGELVAWMKRKIGCAV